MSNTSRPLILGLETSCDETAVAVCKDGKILSNEVSSQSIHSKYGGVVPEIASREHEKFLNLIADSAIAKAKISLSEIDAIAVTQGPGLAGTLLTGISFAKGLSIGPVAGSAIAASIVDALSAYADEVREGAFPSLAHSHHS